jgi:hypothetical protein
MNTLEIIHAPLVPIAFVRAWEYDNKNEEPENQEKVGIVGRIIAYSVAATLVPVIAVMVLFILAGRGVVSIFKK